MREILFKAKRIDNGEWVEGYVFDNGISENRRMFVGGLIITDHKGAGLDMYDVDLDFCEVDETTLCQYTGLTDKNGNKIWENDVVKCVDVNIDAEFYAVVESGNPNGYYSWGYQLKHIRGDEPNLDILLWVDMEVTGAFIEVIGNVFDNSELLGG